MGLVKKKSDDNLKLAQDLIDTRQYNASVHCSYYGCFQFLKCILNHNLKITYSIQNEDRRESHNFILENASIYLDVPIENYTFNFIRFNTKL